MTNQSYMIAPTPAESGALSEYISSAASRVAPARTSVQSVDKQLCLPGMAQHKAHETTLLSKLDPASPHGSASHSTINRGYT